MPEALSRKRIFLVKLINAGLVVCLVVGFSLWAQQTAEADAAVEQQMQEAQRAQSAGAYATDGVFTGSAQGYGGPITMQVTIENGYIADVTLVSAPNEDAPYLEQAVKLIPNIVDAQTSNVDTVSGATYSSVGIINGTMEALQKSNAGEAPEGGA